MSLTLRPYQPLDATVEYLRETWDCIEMEVKNDTKKHP